jgi:hypothetical protein
MLLLPEGKTAQAWELYKQRHCCLEIGEHLMEEDFPGFKTLIRIGLLCDMQKINEQK